VLNRELTGIDDRKLLCFDRVRLLDLAHYWSKNTHKTYQGKLSLVRQFEHDYDVHVLRPTPLLRPPTTPDIPLMWLQESYSLRWSNLGRYGESRPVVYNSIRAIGSSVSQFQAWDTLVSQPASAYFDRQKRFICQPCRITDGLASTLFGAGGMLAGSDETQASVSMLDRNIR
jgi:hypothetical protein